MKWKNLERSSNTRDRRGQGAKVAGGVGGLGIIGVLLMMFLGNLGGGGGTGTGDLGGLSEILNGGQAPAQQAPPPRNDEDFQFFSAVLGTTETVWGDIFSNSGLRYTPPTLVLFSGSTRSACGGATSAIGPHYCPGDQTIYLDTDFFDELRSRFGARGGDFAEAYVVAHEVAHHVQNELGTMDEVHRLEQQNPGDANDLSVRTELQADCYAGVWAYSIYQRENVLEPGDIEEALDAAAAVGDDRIQQAATGRVNPESFTHGSAEQRVRWFERGLESGDPARCDTFSTSP